MSGDRDIAFVAARLIPPSRPPDSEAGAINWLRRNLFDGVTDSILTLILITLIVLVVPPLVDWAVFKSVWNANSLEECRAIVVAAHGEGARGACWAVFRERMDMFLFGFYPPELYWRPVLAFVLLFVALAPVLFSWFPRRLLWFSAIYPILAHTLIWGGFGFEAVHSFKVGGFLLTVTITVTGIAMAIPVGIALALGRQFSIVGFRMICAVLIEFFRGVPLIVLLFGASILMNYFLPPGTSFDLILRVVLVVALASGVYIAEAIWSGVLALPRGQWEAAAALGLSYRRAIWLIILPQALKNSAPQVVRICISICRGVTLVSVVGLLEPVGLLNPIRADATWNGILWELYVGVALLYWVICFPMSRYAVYLENKLRAGRLERALLRTRQADYTTG